MKKLSIGVRLTLWYLAIFAAAECLFSVGMWLALRQDLYGIANDALTAQVDDLTHLLKAQKEKNRTVAKLQEEVSEAYLLEHSGDFLQVFDQDGNWIFQARSLQQHQLTPLAPAAVKSRLFENVTLSDKPYRFITQRIDVNGRAYTVQSGIPIKEMLATLSRFRRYLLMLAPLALLAAAAGGYWLSRRALAPVDALTRTARNISGSNFSDRLETLTTGDELQRLSETLNEMLARIEGAFRRVTQFTADASHELRTPISLMRTEAEIALRKSRAGEEYREALRHILLESERTSSLIEELLALARADSGRENLHLASVNVSSVVAQMANEWRPLVETRNLQLIEAVPARAVSVLADEKSLRRLLTVLLDNAVKYTPAPGTIELRLAPQDGKALISVRDSGIGITNDDQPRIFERFYRADKAKSRELGGAGIGLSIAEWIVQQHRGSIKVHSSVGVGSTFFVELPLHSVETPLSDSTFQMSA